MIRTRQQIASATAGLALLPILQRPALATTTAALATTPALTIAPHQNEVSGKTATDFGVTRPDGKPGLAACQGDRLTGLVSSQSRGDLFLHWHSQVLAANSDDRTRPNGVVQPNSTVQPYDCTLTPGTNWMHSHQLRAQNLPAAPMVTLEADAGDVPKAMIMLHDLSLRPPAEIAAGLRSAKGHNMAGMGMSVMEMPATGSTGATRTAVSGMAKSKMAMSDTPMSGMAMAWTTMLPMIHANDINCDADLADDRTLSDPRVITVRSGPQRLRLINGATATAFWLSTGTLAAQIIAVDGNRVTFHRQDNADHPRSAHRPAGDDPA